MISRELVFGAALAAAALAALPSAASAVAITDVPLGQAAIGGGPVTPTQLAIGNAVIAGDTAAPLPEPVDPGSVLLPGFLTPIGGAIDVGGVVAGYYTSNFTLAQSSGPFGDRRFFSLDDRTQVSFMSEPGFSIGSSGQTSAFSASLFRLDGPSGGGAGGDTIPATMDVTQVTLDTATLVNSLVAGSNFISPNLVFGTALLQGGIYFFDILAETTAENASYKFEIQYQAQPIPLPGVLWLYLSGIAGLICISRFLRR